MPEGKKNEGLQLHQDLAWESATLQVEHWARWVGLALLLVAALGFFGSGPLNKAVKHSGRLQLEYARFGRWKSDVTYAITIQALPGQESVRLWVNQDFLTRVQWDSMMPPLGAVQGGEMGQIMELPLAPGEKEMKLLLTGQTEKIGPIYGAITELGSSNTVEFRQWIYP